MKENEILRNIKFIFSGGLLAFILALFSAVKYVNDISNSYENDLISIKKDMEFSRNTIESKVSVLQDRINDMRMESTKANESQDKLMLIYQTSLNERLSKIEGQQQKTQEMIVEILKMMRNKNG